MRRSVAVVIVTVAVIGLAGRTGAFGAGGQSQQPVSSTPDVLPALLTEVRGLRAAMEKMAAAGPRVQLALGRVQLQEQRISNAIRRLDALRAAVGEAQSQYDRAQERARRTEAWLRNPPPDGDIVALKAEHAQFRQELAQALAQLQRATADEATLSSDLANEQARWTDLNQRMEALEATLGAK